MTLHRHWADLPNDIPGTKPPKPAPVQPSKPSTEDRMFEELMAMSKQLVSLAGQVAALTKTVENLRRDTYAKPAPIDDGRKQPGSIFDQLTRQQRDEMGKRVFLDSIGPAPGSLMGKTMFEAHHAKDALVARTINSVWAASQARAQAACGLESIKKQAS